MFSVHPTTQQTPILPPKKQEKKKQKKKLKKQRVMIQIGINNNNKMKFPYKQSSPQLLHPVNPQFEIMQMFYPK